jgi:hypothetical protein
MALVKKIELKRGLGELLFGMNIEQIINLLGNPSEMETIGEDVEMPSILLHYENEGLSLFFDYEIVINNDLGMPWEQTSQLLQKSDVKTLVCIDIEPENIMLLGEIIDKKSPEEIVKLMVANGVMTQTMDEETWGEKRISFEDYAIDFYFVDKTLTSISVGK